MTTTAHQIALTIAEVRGALWAITPGMLATIVDVLTLRASGVMLSESEIHARIGGPPRERPETVVTSGGIGVVQAFGCLSQRMNLVTRASGGTSTEQLAAEFRDLHADQAVRAIVLAVDSPGGTLYGIEELATEIRAARDGRVPIVGCASSLAGSAAYWLLAQADQVYATPGGDVGSIGVYTVHEDLSGLLAKRGVTPTIISAGPHKVEDSPFAPLTDEARAAMQYRVDAGYGRFVRDVALGRRVPESTVRESYGGGRLKPARDAHAAGMIDGLDTLDTVIARLETTAPPARRMSVTPHEPAPRATGHERHADVTQRQALAALDLYRSPIEG